ncbi:MAG: asparaginase [Hyphomicrobiales bacterium]
MDNPILVEVMRGDFVESVHRGAISIVDASGAVLVDIGDTHKPIFPRSAIKPLQALYLAESGAVEKYGLSDEELALACSSHNGEQAHAAGIVILLGKAGLTYECLECGSQWPVLPADRGALIKADQKPDARHNNCSGKHAGFICATHHLGEKIEGYVKPEHPAQRELKGILEVLTGYDIKDPATIATDGCSIPTYALPLKNLAHAFARFAAASDMGTGRDKAARDIHNACTKHPYLIAGTKRFDTNVMELLGHKALIKTGAEGVYAGMIPSLGLGIALKCEDGTTRASEAMMAGALAAVFAEGRDLLAPYLASTLKNRNGWAVGSVRVVDGLVKRLRQSVA